MLLKYSFRSHFLSFHEIQPTACIVVRVYEGSSGTPLQDTNTCAGSLSVAGLKHRGQKQLPEEFILAYGSRKSIMTDYLLPAQEAEEQQEAGKVINSQGLPPVMDFLHQSSTKILEFLQIASQLETSIT